jgi:glycosyltransferase involved in cell wall biosynthesis
MRVLIVIPAYNEEANILNVVEDVRSAGYDYVVINDGSTDDTARVCEANGINYVNLIQNLGIGGAVQTGHLYAYTHGYDVDIQVDGDGQHDISYVPDLVRAVQDGADLAIGSRFVEESDGFQSSFMRRVGIKWLKHCIKLFTGLTINDSTSGFRASGRRAIELFAHSYPSDYPEPESIVAANKQGLVVREVPVAMRERQGGTSSINALKGAYYMVKVTLAIAIEGFGKRGRG